ncbi:MAG: hypothetical protein CMO38_00080 [Verrucomicrobiaceae bacterium]|nr:hypothetical protein [Verrucomicrobiaceae bacterium]
MKLNYCLNLISFTKNRLYILMMFCLFLTSQIYAYELKVGFAELPITPDLIDAWEDINNDAQFDPDIDKWTDLNGNNQFDAVWMAGFQNKRAAQGVKDDLMAVTAVIDDGQTRIAIISADTIGLMRKFVLSVREDVPAEWGLDYIMVHATHNHEGPDTQGLWGPGFLKSGVNQAYMERLKKDFISTLKIAINNLEPAEMSLALIPTNPLTPIKDKRKPIVIDDDIRAILFNRPDGSIIGSLINFGIHVELTWDKNLELTSDVAGYLRRGISEGIYYDDRLIRAGLGGTTLWLTGNIGGLMTSGPTDPIYDPVLEKMLTKPSHAKARAYGYSLANSVIDAFNADDFKQSPNPSINVHSKEIELGIENFMLSLGTLLGVIDTDTKFSLMPPLVRYLSEVAFIQLGEATITGVPGELYPEIAVGGIENPIGADYTMAPQEVPHLRSQYPDNLNLMVNLANDSIGYIIPKSEWDEDAPWIYGEDEETYGEVVSLGPNTASTIHENLLKLIKESKIK